MIFNLLAIDLEPTPYKVDLWNSFSANPAWNITVLYTNTKDISKDAGHNFQEFPTSQFEYSVLPGHSLWASIRKMATTILAIYSKNIDGVFISGYVNIAPLIAIITCIAVRKPFFVHSDIFNNQDPQPPFPKLKRWIRTLIRSIIFRYSTAILMCGKLGYDSAIVAACPMEKVVDFPYVISRERLRLDSPGSIPEGVESDVRRGRVIVYFSGRMIARKGLSTLLEAIARIERSTDQVALEKDWVVWLVGDGPLLSEYQTLATSLGISHRVCFLGFVQMKVHSWLLRNASIVIVPSLSDAWGIVVDEGMQLGKSVIASSGVGSAVDRIESGMNGLLFPPGDVSQLKDHLLHLLSSNDLRSALAQNALLTSRAFSPERNVANLQQLLDRLAKVSHAI